MKIKALCVLALCVSSCDMQLLDRKANHDTIEAEEDAPVPDSSVLEPESEDAFPIDTPPENTPEESTPEEPTAPQSPEPEVVIEPEPDPGEEDLDPPPPPDEEVPVPPPFEIADIPSDVNIPANFIPFTAESEAMLIDIARLRSSLPDDVPFIRYLTLTHLDYMLFPSEEEFVTHKVNLINSMSVLVNSLSFEPFLTKPTAIDANMSVFRIDIRDFGWSVRDWDDIVLGTNPQVIVYPYFNPDDPNREAVGAATGTVVPAVRADWFLYTASQPENYYSILKIPPNLTECTQVAGVDLADDVIRTFEQPNDKARILRVGIPAGQSGKSPNNRLLERHQIPGGYFWLSYDFAITNGDPTKSIFSSPVGPADFLVDVARLAAVDQFFIPQGYQALFSLPNGLQGFAIFGADGQRLDAADPNLVFDAGNSKNQGIIEAGHSCMSCHGGGTVDAVDQIRDFVLAGAESLPLEATQGILAAHPGQDLINNAIEADRGNYQDARWQAHLLDKRSDRINDIIVHYDANMTLSQAASELNLTVDQFRNLVLGLPDNLAIDLAPLENGSLERETFEAIYQDLSAEFFLVRSQPASPSSLTSPAATGDNADHASGSKDDKDRD